ncbi:hypothetical protein GIV31_11880, partial [Pseudomonas syringae]|nr:hypothetical protein [Pseudomonas syringae]
YYHRYGPPPVPGYYYSPPRGRWQRNEKPASSGGVFNGRAPNIPCSRNAADPCCSQ